MPDAQVQGTNIDLALHTLGWKAFQDLCAHVCEEILKRPVEIYREAQDGGQDAVFKTLPTKNGVGNEDATIQCKFTSKEGQNLKLGDVKKEEENIRELIVAGQANTYIVITNMSVSGPAAVEIKTWLRSLGVIRPHVFGKEFLTQAIKKSVRLRALVPRIYGLGDLSTILDERASAQTKALLGHMLDTLKVYVPTEPHVNAIKILDKQKIVLLLGLPATGKSTIAAILSTIAAEDPNHKCYKVEGPDELLMHWNPHESGGFYWIDDAFGPNQLREDFVDSWIQLMPKIQAAIAGGNRFVLTSRRHIYQGAKEKLGSRNHPLFRDNSAIVDVGRLTKNERRQILYNHIKAGKQRKQWKANAKLHLESLLDESNFLPETARRIADPLYTKNVLCNEDGLRKFVRENRDYLLETLRELPKGHIATLTLIYLHRGGMPVNGADADTITLIEKQFGIDKETIGSSIKEMADSFIIQRVDSDKTIWTFKHPTIADAISVILGEKEGMIELYLLGAKIENILSEVKCNGVIATPDAVIVPESLNGLLMNRLLETPDEASFNNRLFSFLYQRASDDLFRMMVERRPSILNLKGYLWRNLNYDDKMRCHARAYRLGVLPEGLRQETAEQLERALLDDVDTSFLDNDDILALIRPTSLLTLPNRIKDNVLSHISSMAENIAESPDLDIEPEDNFDELRSALIAFNALFKGDDSASDLLSDAEYGIEDATQRVKDRKNKVRAEKDDDWDWRNRSPSQEVPSSIDIASHGMKARSVFSDVDE